MLPVELKPDLLDKLKQGLVRIIITSDSENPADTSTDYVYTLNNTCDKYHVPDNITPPAYNDDTVVAWNVIKNEYSILSLDQIGVYKIYTDREEFKTDTGMAAKHTYNHQTSVDNVDWMLSEIDCCCSDKSFCCADESSLSKSEAVFFIYSNSFTKGFNKYCWYCTPSAIAVCCVGI